MKTTSKLLGAFALVLALTASCKKEAKDNGDTAANDNATIEQSFEEASNISDEASSSTGTLESFKTEGTDESTAMLSGCATVTRDTISSPRKITVDFGTVNCTCADGKQRRGKIITTYTGRYRDAGTVITHTFDNYYVNDNKVEGTRTVTNNGLNGSGQPYFTITHSGSVILADGSGTITHTGTRTRTWIAGYTTLRLRDDVYEITGNGSGVSAKGVNFTSAITTPLVRKMEPGCRQIVSGVIEVTPEEGPTRVLDYGDGTCDGEATLTVGRRTKTITLR